ncbi:MAG: serine hydrolase [Candidatus Flexifilum sp.]
MNWTRPLLIVPLALLLIALSLTARAQTGVTAEALGQANVRATTDVNAPLLGEIFAGTRYAVIGRSELFPWVLIADPATLQPIGWVFAELLRIDGDLNTVPFSRLVIDPSAPTPVPAVPPTVDPLLAPQSPAVTPSPPPAPPAGAVTGTVVGEINIRYGPGVDYPRLGVARAGDVLTIIGTHTQLPWVRVFYPSSPTGEGWVAADLLQISGPLTSLPATSQMTFVFPTLTPTPPVVQQNALLGEPVTLSPEFLALGDTIWGQMLGAGFDPVTSRLGALFLMDVQTGEAISYGDGIAFSGMSVNKIAVLAAFFRRQTGPISDADAFTLAEAMLCSENISTNEILALIGDGNPYTGANRVSEFLETLGLRRTFIYTPYANDPFITPQAPLTRATDADQVSAQPDPYNQMTIGEIGALLSTMVQCAVDERGPLLENPALAGAFTPAECRQMLDLMTYNRIGRLIEVGVPADVPVAHKHGWINDTHGDAAVVFSPGGTYIMAMVLHNPVWLEFAESAPLIEEASRLVYNYFNPDAPLAEVRVDNTVGDLAACNASLLGSPAVEMLLRGDSTRPLFTPATP